MPPSDLCTNETVKIQGVRSTIRLKRMGEQRIHSSEMLNRARPQARLWLLKVSDHPGAEMLAELVQ